ncbi:haloalkane dehalogenase [Rhodococcus spongiicola]|uniref:Alpha/beta fold hydrolase n=1 Tax=Rhodococcus spongiicola TaxID=2487352 RepID=A0A3S3ANN6_9NOCA|nr:haloalkane dehalogenase [Rhodococcus spongiicola]RVW04902.1 alpha/beta fold hydrolase [Rhodococcus spongiicola]
MDTVRTPDECFTDLPGFPWSPHYAETSDGLRMGYIDEGPKDGPVVLLLHGEPSWSYLYRRMIPVLVDAGMRVIAPDLIGFGRSDKPTEVSDYTYARHVEWMRSFLFDALDLHDITMFCQDWGGLIGLRLVGEHPERFARVCASNTGLPDGTRKLPEAWQIFRNFVASTPDLPIGNLISGGCTEPLTPEVTAAYEAPFPDASYKAGARAFPDLIPQDEDNVATPDNRAAWATLAKFDKPFLCLFSDKDPITAGGERALIGKIAGAAGQPHRTIEGGGHFVQEDRGGVLAEALIAWMR